MDDLRQEFWGDLQADLYVKNTAIYLANQSLEQIIREDGYKAHRPIVSHPDVGTYTPHSDIDFDEKSASKQTLEVSTFEYAAEDIDITEEKQVPYDLVQHSLTSIRQGLMNRVEQVYLSEIANADHTISGGTQEVTSANILDFFEEAEGILGAYDAPYETMMRAVVFGPRTVARLRRARGERETGLGDTVSQNGVVGAWNGWIVVQNNNLPWSATLTIDTEPADGDTVTIAGVVFEFQDDIDDTTSGYVGVLRNGTVGTARTNLAAAINGTLTVGTNYTALTARQKFMIRRKRNLTATSVEGMSFTGYGDIAVADDMTTATNLWSAQKTTPVFMIRGAIDLVLQFMELEVGSKEKGFAKLPKGVIGVGAETFDDGAQLMVKLDQDASNF